MKLVFHPEVTAALQGGRPVVALESTLITHGLPRPANLETARGMEKAVRDAGAVPATIAVLGGEVRVGLSAMDLEYLAAADGVRKCSRRDLPIACGLKADGATTVAGTMIVAHSAGIPVFATGGIGGVHRGHPGDISADLIELGRTPVTVVCAGAKSILDLPLTLEVLETNGVPVIGYRCSEFPAFYSRSSGLPVDVRCETAAEIAAIIRSRDAGELMTGILVTVPVPEHAELPQSEADSAIEQAVEEADKRGLVGKEVTPFLLGRVSELTDGRSREANTALLYNNARVAAEIAAALCKHGRGNQ